MAILSNINDLFRVDSAGAVYFGTSAGTNGQILKSVGTGGSPVWIDQTDITGPFVLKAGDTMTGPLVINGSNSLTVGGATTLSGALTGESATFVRDASGYSLRLDSADATTDNDLRFAKGGTDYAAIQINAAVTSDFEFYVNDGTNWINTLTFARADGQATFTKLVSGIAPTADLNFATKKYVDDGRPDPGVTQITAGTNVTITPVGGTGNVTINANTQGDITAITVGNGLAGTSLSGPIPNVLMSGSYTGKFTIDSTGDVEYLALNTTATTNKRVRIQFTQNDNAGMELGTDYSVDNSSNFYFYDRVAGSAMLFTSVALSYFPGKLAVGMTSTPNAQLHVSASGSAAHTQSTGIDVAAGAGGGNVLALDASNNHNWFPYTNGDNYYSANNHLFRGGTGNTPYYMTINTSGNVGIGMGSSFSSKRLHVLGSNHFVTFENTSATANTYTQMLLKAGTANAYIWTANQNSTNWGGANSLNIYTQQAGAIAFFTTAIKRMTIAAGGDVGIGTDSPSTNLHINNDTSNSYATLRLEGSNRGGILQMYNAAYPVSSWTTDQSGNIFFATSGAFAATSLSTKFTILTGGNVGIGISGPQAKLHIAQPGLGEFAGANSSIAGGSHLMLKDEGSTSRTLMSGPSVVFQTPANADGSNIWATSRLLGSPAAAGSARGTFSIQVRDQYDPFSDGTSWNWRTCLTAINTGNVGIGTTSPGYKLNVINDNTATWTARFTNNTNNVYLSVNDANNYGIYVSGETKNYFSGNVGIGTITPGAFKLYVTGGPTRVDSYLSLGNNGYIRADTANMLRFQSGTADITFYNSSNSVEHVRIKNNSGNVGIGADSPGAKLVIATAAGANTQLRLERADGAETGQIYMDTSDDLNIRNTGGSGDIILYPHETTGNTIVKNGNVGIGVTSPGAKLQVGATISASGTGISVNAGAGGGNIISVGTTNHNWFPFTNGQNYYSSDVHNFRSASNTVTYMVLNSTSLTASGDIVAYGSPSDKRLKENIKPIESALDKAMKLQGVTFDWKKSDSILKIKEDIGFIAQDVQKVVPELVRENKDGVLSMRHQGIAPILLEAIKELEARVKELENK